MLVIFISTRDKTIFVVYFKSTSFTCKPGSNSRHNVYLPHFNFNNISQKIEKRIKKEAVFGPYIKEVKICLFLSAPLHSIPTLRLPMSKSLKSFKRVLINLPLPLNFELTFKKLDHPRPVFFPFFIVLSFNNDAENGFDDGKI